MHAASYRRMKGVVASLNRECKSGHGMMRTLASSNSEPRHRMGDERQEWKCLIKLRKAVVSRRELDNENIGSHVITRKTFAFDDKS